MSAATYFARETGNRFSRVKIGQSIYPPARVYNLGCKSKLKLEIIALAPYGRESAFHQLLRDWHISGEWFAPSVVMDGVIDRLQRACFDLASLPEGKRICGAGAFYQTHVGRYSHLPHPLAPPEARAA